MVYHLPLISFFLIALWVDALFYAIAVEDILSLVYIVSIFDFFLYFCMKFKMERFLEKCLGEQKTYCN